MHAQPPGIFENLHAAFVVQRDQHVQTPHLRLGRAPRGRGEAVGADDPRRHVRRPRRVGQHCAIEVDGGFAHDHVRRAPLSASVAVAAAARLRGRFRQRPPQRVVVVVVQGLHRLPELGHVLLALVRREVRDVRQLVLRQGVPAGDALVAPHGAGVAAAPGPDVVLEDEVLADHAGAVPDELVHVEGRGGVGGRLRGRGPAGVGALSVSLLSCTRDGSGDILNVL